MSVRPAKSRNRRSSSGCKKNKYLSQTLLLRTESSPDLFESVQPPKLAAAAATWVMGLRWPSMVDAGRFCLKSKSAKSVGFCSIHAHWRVLYGSRRLLALLNGVRKRLKRVSTGFDSRCTQYLRNLVKSSSKKVITDPSSTDDKANR